jgi:hypothetical protein
VNRTLTLRLTNAPGRDEVARQAVIALAVKAGMPPLAADRAGSAVATAVASCREGDLSIEARVDGGGAALALIGGDDAWRHAAADGLRSYGAAADGDRVGLRLERTPLHPV